MVKFIDTLYGEISLNIPNDTLSIPELQRLRSIRLCNINSPYITGGDGLNRFEHAIGTAYIAQEVVKQHNVGQLDKEAFVLASLFHDIVTAPFGHSLEYLFEYVTKNEYEHANIWQMFLSGKTVQTSRPIYYGMKFSLNTIIGHKLIRKISDILSGEHQLSKILDNDIDIDNIDNVYRFAYHVGIKFPPTTPLNLSKSLEYYNGNLQVNCDSLKLLSNWFSVREKLYVYLLENVGEFSAKALLERALIESIRDEVIFVDDWILTDYELIDKILNSNNPVSIECVKRLMTMNFYEYNNIYVCSDFEIFDKYLSQNKVTIIDEIFSKNVLVHFIRDVNKTRRVLRVFNKYNSEFIEIGKRNDRYLVGFFSDNKKKLEESVAYVENKLGVKLLDKDEYEAKNKQKSLF